MKLELKENMYVRTILGISKLVEIKDDNVYVFDKLDDDLWTDDIADEIWEYELEEVVIKASYNIIDILEIEDYVSTITGECAVIVGIYNDINGKKYLRLCNCIGEYYEDDIKSVITHEQMEQMAYKIGE